MPGKMFEEIGKKWGWICQLTQGGGEERETIIVMIMVRKKAAAAAVRLEDWYAHWTCQN